MVTFAALISLAKVVNVAPVNVTVTGEDNAELVAALADIVNVSLGVSIAVVNVPVTFNAPAL